jgi:nucleotide-binding universal stress UspA family protein
MAGHDDWKDDTVRRDPIRPILVAVDFSAASQRALAWAIEHAARTASDLHTVHVIDRRLRRGDLAADPGSLRDELAEVHAEAAGELAKQVDAEQRATLVLHEHVAIGAPADEILAVAAEINAGTVVVGSHGKGAIERMLLGSVAEKVARHARCTVVVVK